ncbi:hypothetical protein ACFX14_038741 [Malus domestica]
MPQPNPPPLFSRLPLPPTSTSLSAGSAVTTTTSQSSPSVLLPPNRRYTPGEFPLPSETRSAEFYKMASRTLSDITANTI